jgi:hypothetical protein
MYILNHSALYGEHVYDWSFEPGWDFHDFYSHAGAWFITNRILCVI